MLGSNVLRLCRGGGGGGGVSGNLKALKLIFFSYFQSLNSYFKTVAGTGGGGVPNNGTKYHNLCCLGASGTRKHTNI